jgi:dephospho-CoA kinase
MLIGLTSRNAAGKDEVARYLAKRHGFATFSLSDVLRHVLREKGTPVSRETLAAEGNRLRREKGPGALAELALLELEGKDKAVVISLRNPGEVEALRRREDFVLWGVDAPVGIRFRRAYKRGRPDDPLTLEQFIRQEAAELEGSETELQLDRVFQMSDKVLVNEGTLAELYAKVEELL